TEVLALLVAGDGRRGLVRFCVPAGRREVGTSDDDVSVRGETGSMPQGAEFRAAMVDASGVRCDGPTVAYWPSAASVEKLP
ncbi:MAG: hypothetical protein ABEL76_06550, partial [Bradymonadaceae bacterium]